jgi:hypothetical protein
MYKGVAVGKRKGRAPPFSHRQDPQYNYPVSFRFWNSQIWNCRKGLYLDKLTFLVDG